MLNICAFAARVISIAEYRKSLTSRSRLSQQVHPRSGRRAAAAVMQEDDDADVDVEGEDDDQVDGEGEADKSFVLLLPTNETQRGDCISHSSAARATPMTVATTQQ